MIKKRERNENEVNPRGQGTVEYLLVFSVVILIFLAVLRPDGFFYKSLNNTIGINVNSMGRMATKIFNNVP